MKEITIIKYLLSVLAGLLVLILVIAIYLKVSSKGNIEPGRQVVTPTETTTPTATPTPTMINDAVELRKAVLAKSNIPADKFEFSISVNLGSLARGTVRNADDTGGAAWFAGKQGNMWIVTFIGQGVPYCDYIADFNYPITWLSHCIESLGKTVER
ncbi:hypothetical protein IT418_02905 [bacterium]|nr:hypothetical protein [bacterium]